MESRFEQFLKERKYLKNVSARTIQWYTESFKWFSNPAPSQADLTAVVIRMREAGLCPSSCNNRIRAINAYLKWAQSTLKVAKLKEPVKVPPIFPQDDILKFAKWKPKGYMHTRLQVLILLLADTGTRLDEALSLKWADVDFDNILITVTGKGDKQRVIPFSFELRKHLFKFRHEHQLVFATRDGGKLHGCNVWRDVHALCGELGIHTPERLIHALRHSFATHFIRQGGNVLLLQKSLGHTTVTMSQKYCHLNTADLQAVHQRVSLLSK